MCDEQRLVPIPDHLRPEVDFDATHPEFGIDAEGRECISMDACIAPAVEALWAARVVTFGCCCGHGSGKGVVSVKTEAYQTAIPQEVLDLYCEHNWQKWECPTCNEEEALKQERTLPPAEEAGTAQASARGGNASEGKGPRCASCGREIKSMVWTRIVAGRRVKFHQGCLPRRAEQPPGCAPPARA